ncbi:hypothetical protein ACLESD_00270 [Pyxidicoccus sp. 3LFB2]
MLLDMYLFFCLPFPSPVRAAPKVARAPRGGSGRRAAASGRTPSRQGEGRSGQAGKGTGGKRRTARPVLKVIEGGRAGVP